MKLYKIPGLNKDFGIAAEEIIRVQAVSNYSRIYFAKGNKLLTSKVRHCSQDLLQQ